MKKIMEQYLIKSNPAVIASSLKMDNMKNEFNELYLHNCLKAGRELTHIENTLLFINRSTVRLLAPPRGHYADDVYSIGDGMYARRIQNA